MISYLLVLFTILLSGAFTFENKVKTKQSYHAIYQNNDSSIEIAFQHNIDSFEQTITRYNDYIFDCDNLIKELDSLQKTILKDSMHLISCELSFLSLVKNYLKIYPLTGSLHLDQLVQRLKDYCEIKCQIDNNSMNISLESDSIGLVQKNKAVDSIYNIVCKEVLRNIKKEVLNNYDSLELNNMLEKLKPEYLNSLKTSLRLNENRKFLTGKKLEVEKKLAKLNAYKNEFDKNVAPVFDKLLSPDLNRTLLISFHQKKYRCFILGDRSDSFDIRVQNNESKVGRTIKMAWDELIKDKFEPVFIMNAGMFKDDYSPQGLLIENGTKISELDTNSVKPLFGNFYMYPNGIFFIRKGKCFVEETNSFIKNGYTTKSSNIKYATQSGPMLVTKKVIHKKFTPRSKNINIRNGVGIRKRGSNCQSVFVISEEPVNFYDFAIIFKDLMQCDNALYFDGVVSRMYFEFNKIKSGNLDNTMGLGPVISITRKKPGK